MSDFNLRDLMNRTDWMNAPPRETTPESIREDMDAAMEMIRNEPYKPTRFPPISLHLYDLVHADMVQRGMIAEGEPIRDHQMWEWLAVAWKEHQEQEEA